MRTPIATVLALAALAAPAAAATPPGDDPGALFSGTTCSTLDKAGVAGQYGAWGSYIAGCTVTVRCPSTAHMCVAVNHSTIATQAAAGDRVTLNARTRVFDGAAVYGFSDVSCAGTNTCGVDDSVMHVGRGQNASVQCNGVRQTTLFNRAHVSCSLILIPR